MYFQFNGVTNLTGALNLTTLLDPKYILTSTGSLSSTVMGYLVNISSDVQTQINSKQNIFLNNVSNTWTSNIGNYNYDFRRSDGTEQNFYIGNSNTSTTSTSNLYLSGPNNNSAFSISVGNGNTTLTHNNSGGFIFNSLTSQNIYFMFNGNTNLGMSSTSATFYNDLYINGSLILNNKLNPIYISTSTGTLSAAIMGYLVNITSDVQTQLNSKQSILWNYNTGTSPNAYYLSPSSNYSLNIVRTDTVNASYIEMGNRTNLTDTYIDF